MERKCSRCGETKPDAFTPPRTSDGGADRLCRRCRSEYSKEHYQKNRERYIKRSADRKRLESRRRQAWLIEYFKSHPCVDCGETDVVVLDFDHLTDKAFNVSSGLTDRCWEDVLDEIAKCEVVCANCHRRRTAARKPTYRSLLIAAPRQRRLFWGPMD